MRDDLAGTRLLGVRGRGARRRGGQDGRGRGVPVGRARPGRLHPHRRRRRRRRRRGRPTSPASSRRRGCAGCAVVHVPTTLLGMVDAAVGGKTGINTAEGKNLVGAFHPPAGVLCDLSTLDDAAAQRLRRRAGRGGQVRLHRRPGDPRPRRGATPRRPTRPDGPPRCASSSSAPSRSRPRSSPQDLQRVLAARDPQLRAHVRRTPSSRSSATRGGTARRSSVGMVYVAELARLAGRLDDDTVERHRSVLAALGLPIDLPRRPLARPATTR